MVKYTAQRAVSSRMDAFGILSVRCQELITNHALVAIV